MNTFENGFPNEFRDALLKIFIRVLLEGIQRFTLGKKLDEFVSEKINLIITHS